MRCPPRIHFRGWRKGWWAWVPVSPTIVWCLFEICATCQVTTECSTPVSTIKSAGWPPTDIQTMGSWGLRRKEPSQPTSSAHSMLEATQSRLSLLSLFIWPGAMDTHFSSVPLGDRRHTDFSLVALIPGALLVGSFLGSPFACSLAFALTGTVPPSIHLMLLPVDLLSFLSFVLPPFELPGLS
jgi:hypothetical protein